MPQTALPRCFCAAALALVGLVTASAGLEVTMSDPVLVAEAPAGVREWGWYQFPVLDRTVDGKIALTFHVHPDSARAYGLKSDEANRAISDDNGRTWTRQRATEPTAGLLLPNGDRIHAVLPKSLPPSQLRLPPPAGVAMGTYGRLRFEFYRHDDLPSALRGVPLLRRTAGAAVWQEERARLDDSDLLRYTTESVFPVVWLGDMHVAPDGTILAVVYPSTIAGPDSGYWQSTCYASVDSGHSWQVRGRISYRPEVAADPKAEGRDGFSEPASVLLADGSLLAVLRSTDGLGVGPMYRSRSTDGGRTWSAPESFAPNGVMPRLLQLGNGVLVLSSGRPGAQVRFSTDGRGERWDAPRELVPVASADIQADTCGYTSLLPLSDDSFLIAYSWFTRPGTDGQPHKSILVRQVTVRR